MAGFLMGAAGSARRVNAEQYNSMASVLSPDSRARIPDTNTALALLQDFEALSLGEGSGGAFCSASHSCLSLSCVGFCILDVCFCGSSADNRSPLCWFTPPPHFPVTSFLSLSFFPFSMSGQAAELATSCVQSVERQCSHW